VLLKAFPAAFLGRVTVVPYRPLAHESIVRIVRLHLDHVVRRMAERHDIALTYEARVLDYIVGRCLVQETGARVLIGFIDQHVLPRLSALWLDAFSSKRPLARINISVADENAPPSSALVFRPAYATASGNPEVAARINAPVPTEQAI
jgi:type VI secretion system protein VasG